MDSIHQAMLKSGGLLHKIALVQSQRNSTVYQWIILLSPQISTCANRNINYRESPVPTVSVPADSQPTDF